MGKKREKNRIELLSPAGTFDHLRAAVNSGADAVYLGGKMYSARANAGNFSNDEIEEAVRYCHLRGVRVYVTVNTLIFDDELREALEFARFLYGAGVDALIVQDFGLALCIRREMPDFPLHLSTQGTVYNAEGMKAAKQLGFRRVVLAREVSIAEMREIAEAMRECDNDDEPVEFEVFCHGALCFCYSGQCQMSRSIGGRSGNRGACAQPCRLAYTGKEGTSYMLSPKDLCTVDFLGELIEAGASSLKIEGRMKSPEYVAVVTGIYRKYIDKYYEGGSYTVSDEDRRALSQIFNRGGFTDGYMHGNPGDDLMSGYLPKHQGVRIGEVVRRIDRNLIEIRADRGETLSLGDGIEIRNEEMPGNVVTFLEERSSGKGGVRLFAAGDIKGTVRCGDPVYRITERALTERAALTYALDREGNERCIRKSTVDMKLIAYADKPAALSVRDTGSGVAVSVQSDVPCTLSYEKPLTEERVSSQLARTGNTTFAPGRISFVSDGEAFLPVSEINAMRREALAKLADAVICARTRKNEKHENEFSGAEIPCAELCTDVPKTVPVIDFTEGGVSDAVPCISNVTRGNEDAFIRGHFAEIVEMTRECGIVCGNIGWLYEFARAGVPVTAGSGLNAANGASAFAMRSLGASAVLPSAELSDSPKTVMITEHILPCGKFGNSRGDTYEARLSRYGDKTVIEKI